MKKSSVSVDTLQVLDEEALAQVVGGRRDGDGHYGSRPSPSSPLLLAARL